MTVLSLVIENHLDELELLHGPELLPSHRQALRAMVRCRRQGSDLMVLECPDCKTNLRIPHSCGHRSCPHCQHHESQQWLEKQQGKLLPVTYFMVTFTVPAELRPLFWAKQRICYDLLLKTAWETIDSFARRDPQLKGQTGAHAVLHTHNRMLGYHPHVHLIVPAGAVNKKDMEWRSKGDQFLFPERNLAKVFRAKWFDGMRRLGLQVNTTLPNEWVADCKAVGQGKEALAYLGRYLYRGVLPEKNILSDKDGQVTFRIKTNEGEEVIQTVPGGEFLWLLLQHVLPRRFRRVRDYGLLHSLAKQLVQLLQLLLRVVLPLPMEPRPRPAVLCPHCGVAMTILAVRVKHLSPLLC
jgi:hypothetical protein